MDTKFIIECSWDLLHLQWDYSIQAVISVSKDGHESSFLNKDIDWKFASNTIF